MRLCMFSPKGMDLERGWPGRVEGDRVVQLAAQTLQAFFTGGGGAREHAEYALADCDLLAPVLYPPSVRVFSPFEALAEPWFSFASPFPVLAPGAEVAWPGGSTELVYGLALAALIGAEQEIAGFTLANSWTARDLAREERRAGFGPSKSSDFGLSLGPLLVTADAFEGRSIVARVNGEERGRLDLTSLVHPWEALRARAAAGTRLRSGDLLVARAPVADGEALAAGDLVELECEGIGTLAGRVGAVA